MLMREAAARIRLLVLDVDGVLTDNGVYVGLVDGRRVELKQFNIQDGLGFSLLRGSGIEVAWLSGRVSDATAVRAAELRIDDVIQTPDGHKLPAMQAMLARRGLSWDEVAFVGDDLADVPVMERVGLPIAVANAVPEVKGIAAHITAAAGGRGAVREAIETILRARGGWEAAVARYLTPRQALA
jgi:3-deoxy-D-manno-octulosonate 8-phosphate phosphatase (KDO 8-P phosphatase)